VAELPALAEAITSGSFDVDARPMPLAAVTEAWTSAAGDSRRIRVDLCLTGCAGCDPVRSGRR
jgi:hypothetical protein